MMALHSKSDAWCVRSMEEMTSVFCSTSSYVDGSTLSGDGRKCHLAVMKDRFRKNCYRGMSGTYLGVLNDSVAKPNDARQRIPSFDDADEDEGPAEAEGSLCAGHSLTLRFS